MNPNSRDINENWNFFRNNLTALVDRNLPKPQYQSKSVMSNNKNAKKCNKSHKEAKHTGRNSD